MAKSIQTPSASTVQPRLPCSIYLFVYPPTHHSFFRIAALSYAFPASSAELFANPLGTMDGCFYTPLDDGANKIVVSI